MKRLVLPLLGFGVLLAVVNALGFNLLWSLFVLSVAGMAVFILRCSAALGTPRAAVITEGSQPGC